MVNLKAHQIKNRDKTLKLIASCLLSQVIARYGGMKKLTILLFAILMSACNSATTDEENNIIDDPETENPIAKSTETFGVDGNLWKPRGDETASGAGNLVVLFSSKFRRAFDSCEVPLRSGGTAQLRCVDDQPWTEIPYSCFTNGNRQTWRANFKCSDAAQVRVVCRDPNQEVTFTVPEAQRGAVCSRFG